MQPTLKPRLPKLEGSLIEAFDDDGVRGRHDIKYSDLGVPLNWGSHGRDGRETQGTDSR
jgi:hypothetical protein